MFQMLWRRWESVSTTIDRDERFSGLDVAYGFDLKCNIQLRISVVLGFVKLQKSLLRFSLPVFSKLLIFVTRPLRWVVDSVADAEGGTKYPSLKWFMSFIVENATHSRLPLVEVMIFDRDHTCSVSLFSCRLQPVAPYTGFP